MFRTIKSYALRSGRISKRQQYALENFLGLYSLEKQFWDYETLFKRKAKTIIEIGFGMGDSLAQMAELEPENNFIGIEVHRPGIGSLLATIHEKNLNNLRIVTFDAVEAFRECIADESLDAVQIFFPDPWPKKRHHKRRLIQSDFVKILTKKLKKGGIFHCATDWEDYAQHINQVLKFEQMLQKSDSASRFRPLTKFENRGQRLGHEIWEFLYTKTV